MHVAKTPSDAKRSNRVPLLFNVAVIVTHQYTSAVLLSVIIIISNTYRYFDKLFSIISYSDIRIRCPSCQAEWGITDLVDNQFLAEESNSKEATENTEDTLKRCTGCEPEENSVATSFCSECAEYLCDQCVQAHRRVKVTKDHTIQPKDNVSVVDPSTSAEKVLK